MGPRDDGWHAAAAQAAAALSRQVEAAAASPVSTGSHTVASVGPPRIVPASASYYAGSVPPAWAASPVKSGGTRVAQQAFAGSAAPQMAQPSPRLQSPAPARAAVPPLVWAPPPQTPPARPRACAPGPGDSVSQSPRRTPRQMASPCLTPRVAAPLPMVPAVAAVPVVVSSLPVPAAAPSPQPVGPLAPQLRLWQALPTDGLEVEVLTQVASARAAPLRQLPGPIASPSLASRLFAARAAASPRPPSRGTRSARSPTPSAPSPATQKSSAPWADASCSSARSRSSSCKIRL